MRKTLTWISGIVAGISFPLFSSAQGILSGLEGLGLSNRPPLEIIANLTKWLLSIFGFIAIIAFLISGIQYLVSAGDEDMQKRAKRNLSYSIIGVIVGLSGLIIVNFVQNILK